MWYIDIIVLHLSHLSEVYVLYFFIVFVVAIHLKSILIY